MQASRAHYVCQRQVSHFVGQAQPADPVVPAVKADHRANGSVLQAGEVDGPPFFVEVRMPGRSLTEALRGLTGALRTRALDSYLDAVVEMGTVGLDVAFYGELLADDPHRATT